MKKIFFILFILNFIIVVSNAAIYTNSLNLQLDTSSDLYEKEKVDIQVNSYFDEMYPLNAKEFILFKGKERITENQFIALSKDELLIKNFQMINKVKLGGFTTAICMGATSSVFLITGLILIGVQANFFNIPALYNNPNYTSWFDYYNKNYISIYMPGLLCLVVSGAALCLMIVDFTVTYTLLQKYKFNERMYREAVDRYNETIRKRLNYFPDISYNGESISLNYRFKFN